MRAWLLKRLLVCIPTLLLIVLLVFGVVNAVPAVPLTGEPTADESHHRQSYMVFRKQFGLDRPVFLNLRHATGDETVLSLMKTALDGGDVERQEADEHLTELGRFGIPGLIAAVEDPASPETVRALGLKKLGEVALHEIVPGEDEEIRRWKNAENKAVSALSNPGGDVGRRAAAWRTWHDERAEQFAPGILQRLRVTLFETRFAVYLGNLLRLDFGKSMSDFQPVLPTLVRRLGNSALISFLAIFLAYVLSVPLGVASAVLRGRRSERALSVLLFALYSLPTYFAATLLLRFLSVGQPFNWFPTGRMHQTVGYDELSTVGQLLDQAHHLVLPVFCLTYAGLAVLSRYSRNSVLEILGSDFVRTARAKGLSEKVVLLRHALRNALLPLITLLGNVLPAVFSGAVIIEIIFDIPGMGSYIYNAVLDRDYNVIMATSLISAVLTLLGYLLADLAYAAADPRISVTGRGEVAR